MVFSFFLRLILNKKITGFQSYTPTQSITVDPQSLRVRRLYSARVLLRERGLVLLCYFDNCIQYFSFSIHFFISLSFASFMFNIDPRPSISIMIHLNVLHRTGTIRIHHTRLQCRPRPVPMIATPTTITTTTKKIMIVKK